MRPISAITRSHFSTSASVTPSSWGITAARTNPASALILPRLSAWAIIHVKRSRAAALGSSRTFVSVEMVFDSIRALAMAASLTALGFVRAEGDKRWADIDPRGAHARPDAIREQRALGSGRDSHHQVADLAGILKIDDLLVRATR